MKDGVIDWVIAGGESGTKSRPMSPEWVRSLRDQCIDQDVAFHFKQWGHWAPIELLTVEQKKILIFDTHEMAAAGKKHAGRNLDGRTWDQLPKSA
jgi:protein gp37